jgi:gas vesicle protein
MEDTEVSAKGIDVYIYTGIVVGLVIGLLFAPQSGDETRAMLRNKVLQVQAKAAEVADRLK